MQRLKAIADHFRRELHLYKIILGDRRTPRYAKWLLGLAVVYAVSPIDFIPDFIPFFGQLDDLVIVPLLIYLAIRLIPPELVSECRKQVLENNLKNY